jgi:signal transduction histidine kinase
MHSRAGARDGGGITRQVAVIVLGSLFLAHALSVAIWFGAMVAPPPVQVLAARITLAARLLDAVAPADRPALVTAAETSGLTMRLVPLVPGQAPPEIARASGLTARLLRHALRQAPGGPPLPIEIGSAAPAEEGGDLIAEIALSDGTWLLLRLPPHGDEGASLMWFPPLVDLIFGALPLALLSIWAAWRVTGPLVRLAAATGDVGAFVAGAGENPPPLPEEGTREIRQVARALNGLLEKLRRLVVDRTRMLAAISHDLRTPLTRLRLRAESVADGVLREKMLQDILRMDAMISATLAFIREDALQEPIEKVDMAALLITVCDGFADGGADVSYVGPLHAAGTCRPQAMERALNNLIDNAVKFAGRAVVTLHPAALNLALGGVIIDVEDDGPGIPAAQKAEVVKPFTRGDAARGLEGGGVGLGLAITRSIIQSHGGSLALDDRLPHGLRARIHLPDAATSGRREVARSMTLPAGSASGRPALGRRFRPGSEPAASVFG